MKFWFSWAHIVSISDHPLLPERRSAERADTKVSALSCSFVSGMKWFWRIILYLNPKAMPCRGKEGRWAGANLIKNKQGAEARSSQRIRHSADSEQHSLSMVMGPAPSFSFFCITVTSTPHRYYRRNQGFRLVPGLRSSQPIMVGVACWSLHRRSSQGEGAGSRGHARSQALSTLQSLTHSNLSLPLRPHLLKAPEPSKHQYKPVFKTGAHGDIPDSNHATF